MEEMEPPKESSILKSKFHSMLGKRTINFSAELESASSVNPKRRRKGQRLSADEKMKILHSLFIENLSYSDVMK
jgi:hypothetical protein